MNDRAFRFRTTMRAAAIALALAGAASSARAATVTETQILNGIAQLRASANTELALLNTLQTSDASQTADLTAIKATLTSMQVSLTNLTTLVNSLQQSVSSIPRDARKKYYLTPTFHDGAHATNACQSGYHMASLWEIADVSNLQYESSLGVTSADSGRGPSSIHSGWVRTGWTAATATQGAANCNGWSSVVDTDYGTELELNNQWDESPVNFNPVVNPWRAFASSCDVARSVWCMQN